MRKPIFALLGSLGAILCIGAVAAAATIAPTSVTASVFPPLVLKAPYTFTVSGTIHYSSCPDGFENDDYCSAIPPKKACTGTVSLTVKLGPDALLADGGQTILTTSGPVSSKCTYSITVTLPTSDFTAKSRFKAGAPGSTVAVNFQAKFLGNSVLSAKSAPQVTAIAALTEPK